MLKVTSKNGKTASPVGFVTFNSRAGADAAKQDLQVRLNLQLQVHLFHQICNLTENLYSIYDLSSHTKSNPKKELPAKAPATQNKLQQPQII